MSNLNEFRSVDISKPVKILREPTDMDPITVPALMKRTAENYADHTALMFEDASTQQWKEITYREYREKVERMAKVFMKLGLKRHGTVAILATNSVEWFVSELAAIHAGGVFAGIYPTNSIEACHHILQSSKANIVVVDTEKQLEKIRQIKDKLPHLKAVIQTLPPHPEFLKHSEGFYRWNELEAMPVDDVQEDYEKRLATVAVNECCCLIYTSGTVGMPKGVMLSHDNLTCNSFGVKNRFQFHIGKERFVSYLPLSHIAGQLGDVFVPLLLAGTVYFADKDALSGTLPKTLLKARPTFFSGVPRVYEKIQEKMASVDIKSNSLQQMITAWAKNVTMQHHMNNMSGLQLGSFQYKLAQKFVNSKVKTALGFQHCRYFLTGGAPMLEDTTSFFLSFDIKLLDLYGLSECAGPHMFACDDSISFETNGKALQGYETKIINHDEKGHGEICLKGRHVFMGYLNEPEKTAETFDEGWMKTGDVGFIDENGLIFVTGRIKELIITAGGENIPPTFIANIVKSECAAISQAFLVGDKRKFLTMLITLKTEMSSDGEPLDDLAVETVKWLEEMNLKYRKLSEILAAGPDDKVVHEIQSAIDKTNKKAISNAQKIQKFAILSHDFSLSTGELGPTMKVKRNFVMENYSDIIESFYK